MEKEEWGDLLLISCPAKGLCLALMQVTSPAEPWHHAILYPEFSQHGNPNVNATDQPPA